MSWDEYYMSLVYLTAAKSEDEHTHIGAVIVGPDHEIRSTGYNGMPRGIKNKPERQERPEKYFWFEHAERNAIYNAVRVGTPLKGCTIYINAMPCTDCARAIIQSGITKVVVDVATDLLENHEQWKTQIEVALKMLKEANIDVLTIVGVARKIDE